MSTQDAPVTISIVGTGTGDGGGVAPTPNGTIATTPGNQPDLRINVVAPIVALAVRFGHAFLASFLGTLTAAGVGGEALLGAHDFPGVLRTAALVAGSTAGLNLVKDLVTVFGRLEGRYPLASGSI